MDTVFFYFAGHGRANETRFYLLPYDFEEAKDPDLEQKACSFRLLQQYLMTHQPRNYLFFIDTCHSGMASEHIDPSYGLHFRGDTECRATFSSCQRDELAAGHDEVRHGVFTHFLINGLRGEADLGGDGRVDINELWTYINDQMSVYHRKKKVYQTPRKYGDISGKLLLPSCGGVLQNYLTTIEKNPRIRMLSLLGMKKDICDAGVFLQRTLSYNKDDKTVENLIPLTELSHTKRGILIEGDPCMGKTSLAKFLLLTLVRSFRLSRSYLFGLTFTITQMTQKSHYFHMH